ncbi:hypothetical protein [uncultured Aquimarina sp.]|uniref:hypothetical protein n=1 Tax=uncultured Aquimarina sp. TaxID=575652 RepID=UPI00260EA8F0|nr:hypothetical protein [uncultured Aquimarina sp.]
MAPLKFEDSIKEKLEQRTIQPSNGSWDKLEEQLGQKKVKKYQWFGIAASIVGFLVITTVFITYNKDAKSSDVELVDIDKEIIKKDQSTDFVEITTQESKSKIKKNQDTEEGLTSSVVIVKNDKKESDKTENDKLRNSIAKEDIQVDNSKTSIQEDVFKENTSEAVVVQTETINNEIVKEDKLLQVTTEVIDSKIASVIEKVKELEKNKGIVTDAEVEALLRNAQIEITTQQILKSNTVSASALLLDVESELDESFKDRVFEALKTGFEKLKTTVAERDN